MTRNKASSAIHPQTGIAGVEGTGLDTGAGGAIGIAPAGLRSRGRRSIKGRLEGGSPVRSRRRNGNVSGDSCGNAPFSRKKNPASLALVAKGLISSATSEGSEKNSSSTSMSSGDNDSPSRVWLRKNPPMYPERDPPAF